MDQIQTASVQAVTLPEDGMYMWGLKGRRAARYRVQVKRSLRKTCAITGAKAWVVLSPDGNVVEIGQAPRV